MAHKFNYTYSSSVHSEVEEIRQKYTAASDKLDQLRQLDKSCERPGTIAAVIVGAAGTLLLGGGLAMILETAWMTAGIVLGAVGLGIMALALPVFRYMTERRRREIAPEILRLSDEIEKGGPSA